MTPFRLFSFLALAGAAGGALFVLSSSLVSVRADTATASVEEALYAPRATRIAGVAEPLLSASSSLAVYVGSRGEEQTLFEANAEQALPIASITKLMVAALAVERYAPDAVITLSESALSVRGASGAYYPGDSLMLDGALHALLIASHNEIASALAEPLGPSTFLGELNRRANELGLKNTIFTNVTGLDPMSGSDEINRSTARDLSRLARVIEETHPELFAISSQQSYVVRDTRGRRLTTLVNTDSLLRDSTVPFTIIGSKTGETPRARQNLLLVTEAPCGGRLYSVVLGSSDRVKDMRTLLAYAHNAYTWTCGSEPPAPLEI